MSAGTDRFRGRESAMGKWFDQAKEKMNREKNEGIFDNKGKAIRPSVVKALLDFAGQEDEFAQAIVQGGSLSDCIAAVLKGVGRSISDLEVYKRAAAFYFPGADVHFSMRIDLAPAAEQTDTKPDKPKGLLLDLSAFL